MTATILLVDDIEANLKLLEESLTSAYYTVLTANSKKQALDIIKHNKIDVVLLDFTTIQTELFRICKQIRSNPNSTYIPIVIITSRSRTDDRIKGLEAGVDSFLTKPVSDIELFARIDSLTRMKSVMDELSLRNQTHTVLGADVIHVEEDLKKSKVIIINDDLFQLKYIEDILKDCTGKIKRCTNPKDIDNILKNFIPDLCIISCDIPNIDPLRICATLRSKEELQHALIILMANKEHNNTLIQGIEIGIGDYILNSCNEKEIIARVITQLRHKIYIEHLIHNLESNANDAIKDGLTNIFNRRYFDNHVTLMADHAVKAKKYLVLAMIDIDNLKTINDRFGHQTGDLVLQGAAKILKKNLRITDLVARYGGDEFVVVIYSTSMMKSENILNRIRQKFKEYKFDRCTQHHDINVTLSAGIAIYTGGSIEKIMNDADNALYRAKSLGRNKVICHKE